MRSSSADIIAVVEDEDLVKRSVGELNRWYQPCRGRERELKS